MKANQNYFIKLQNRKLNENKKDDECKNVITIKTTLDIIKTMQFLLRLLAADIVIENEELFEEIYENCKD